MRGRSVLIVTGRPSCPGRYPFHSSSATAGTPPARKGHMATTSKLAIAKDVTELIGRTPLVSINRIGAGLPGRIVAKLESFNPASSVKDRIGVAMIDAAERSGHDRRRTPSCSSRPAATPASRWRSSRAVRGYRLVLMMPETMSIERRKLLKAFGAELILTPGRRRDAGRHPPRAGAGRHRPPLPDPPAVREPGQPGRPPPDDGRGDLAGHRRPDRLSSSPASAPAGRSPASAR